LPYKEPEQRRAYIRSYTERNREKLRAQKAQYYQDNREVLSAANRASYQKRRREDPDKVRARNRAYYAANREKLRAYHHDYYVRNRADDAARRHGLQPEDWAQIWTSQNGRCYLCGQELAPSGRSVAIDHDHSCCPEKHSCQVCRRGLACMDCNIAIGHAREDPARLRRMADALEKAKQAFDERRLLTATGPALF